MVRNIKRRHQALGAAVLMGLMLGVGCGGGGSSDAPSGPTVSNDAGTNGHGDDGGPTPPPPVDAGCVAQPGVDLPDDDFTDSNCDGIDGDRTQAIFVASGPTPRLAASSSL